MGKIVKRLMLDDIYAIGRNESWFSGMASQGLHLKKFGRLFVDFEKGEAKETNYRIDYLKEAPAQEQLDVYHDCGWNFIANNGYFYVFFADEKAYTTELHTDPVEQGFTLSELNQRIKNNLIILSIAMLLFLGMMISIYSFNDEPFLLMMEGQFVQQIFLVLVELYLFYSIIRNYRVVRNLKQSLLRGTEIDHNQDYRKARLWGGILAGIFLPMALFTIIIPVVEIAQTKDYTLPEGNTNLPIIRLAEIEKSPGFRRETDFSGNNLDRANRVSCDWSLLAPVQYEIDEHGVVNGEVWEDNGGVYSPSITTRYYKLTFGSMAENLTLNLINRYVWRDNAEVKEVNQRSFDKLYMVEDGSRKQIFAYWDNQVIHVTYYGKERIEDIIPPLAQKIS
ncbi:DUF2812 domain-containing protein [Desulfosporosinus meridiei]|uniref:DUF2812 domain-containing protein n=1 Tax=Desulfosporosinus meridiei (strain ATCC BAA-275 / DSM 13257 / KCTC 12902 / NCIMB 13706 / S10) TaxID=768704 RepID=J7IW90_DESMD|nr:DUF2812 domain-containing protein [Desulfosporosinus meridiei]AFQ43368.1 Protein of unknown function (DUF2812) [Desulfosporosinus meridiei DSM 13257]